MPKKQLQKIVKAFRRNSGVIQMDHATDVYLESCGLECVTYNADTVLLSTAPSRAAILKS